MQLLDTTYLPTYPYCIHAAIGRVLASFRRIMRRRAYVTDISLAGMPARAPSMLLDTIRVGSNTYMGVSRAYDEAMAAPSSVSRALLNPFLRGSAPIFIPGAPTYNLSCHCDCIIVPSSIATFINMECSRKLTVGSCCSMFAQAR